jgi:hypothetical protein
LAVVLQGMVFAPIPFQPEALLLASREPAAPAADQVEPADTVPTAGLAATISDFFRRMVFPPLDVSWIVLSELLILNVNFLVNHYNDTHIRPFWFASQINLSYYNAVHIGLSYIPN